MADSIRERHSDILEPGTVLAGRFEIVEHLAEGGMGRVYIALQRPIRRKVALKVMRRELVGDNSSVKRFFREAIAVSKLTHPNTITIIDYGESEDGQVFIAMEFLDGVSLDQLLRHDGMSLSRAVNIVGQITRSLSEAHRKGIVHRDLKPENIFICDVEGNQDFVKVLDFGIARLQLPEGEEGGGATRITREGYVCGTPEYMSPEQARGEEFDGRTDLYALGVMFWEMIEGRVPYEAPTPLGIVLKHQSDPIPEITADVSEEVKQFIYRAMSKDMDDRPNSAESFLEELLSVCPVDMGLEDSSSFISARRPSITPGAPGTPPAVKQTNSDLATAATQALLAHEETPSETLLDISPEPTPEPLPAFVETGRPRIVPVLVGAVLLLVLSVGALTWAMISTEGSKGSGNTTPATSGSVALTTPTPEADETRLMVAGSPADAQIRVAGKPDGPAPKSFTGKPGTSVEVTITKEGFVTTTLTGIYPEAGEKALRYTLAPIPAAPAKVEVTSNPVGATVFRGEEKLGVTPLSLDLQATEEPFELRLAHADHKDATIKVTQESADKGLNVTLEAETVAEEKKPRRPRGDKTKPKGQGGKKTKVVSPPATPKADKPAVKPEKSPKPDPPAKKTEPKYKLVN